jgi:hypothetical protein
VQQGSAAEPAQLAPFPPQVLQLFVPVQRPEQHCGAVSGQVATQVLLALLPLTPALQQVAAPQAKARGSLQATHLSNVESQTGAAWLQRIEVPSAGQVPFEQKLFGTKDSGLTLVSQVPWAQIVAG